MKAIGCRLGDLLLSLNDDEQQAKLREASAALRQLTDSSRPQAQATLAELNDRLAQLSRERQRREQLFKRQLLSVEQLEQARQVELIARLARDRAKLAATAQAPGGSEEQVLRQRLGGGGGQSGQDANLRADLRSGAEP